MVSYLVSMLPFPLYKSHFEKFEENQKVLLTIACEFLAFVNAKVWGIKHGLALLKFAIILWSWIKTKTNYARLILMICVAILNRSLMICVFVAN